LNINNLLFGDSKLPDCENESNVLVIQDPKEDGTKLDKYSGTVLLTIL
jgi:hypothetical protein